MRRLVMGMWLLLPGSLVSTSRADEPLKLPAKERFHLCLLIGQSNMAGRGAIEGILHANQDTSEFAHAAKDFMCSIAPWRGSRFSRSRRTMRRLCA